MIESIALALVKTLATYLFKTYVLVQTNVKIEGAPSWYMKNVPSAVCVYDAQYGGLESIDAAKSSALVRMNKELTAIIENIIYENYHNLKDPKEKAFVYMFKNDAESPIFVQKNTKFPNIEYSKKQRIAFVQACVDKQTIIDYQTERSEKIKYELTHKRAGDAFEELESGDMKLE